MLAASVAARFTIVMKSAQEGLGGIKSVCGVTPASTQPLPRGWDRKAVPSAEREERKQM